MDAMTWDALLTESLRHLESMPASGRLAGRVPLRMRRLPVAAWLTNKTRKLAAIHPDLRTVMRKMVLGESPWPLVITGAAGVGKTCAALCLLDHAGGLYFTAQGLADEVLYAGKGQVQSPGGLPVSQRQLWQEIAGTSLVVVDEVGTREKVSDWHYDCFKRVLDEREGKPLVVLSNLALDAIVTLYDDRVTSRLAAGTVFTLQGSDRRLHP